VKGYETGFDSTLEAVFSLLSQKRFDSTQEAVFLLHLLKVILHYDKPKMNYNAQFFRKSIINEKWLSITTNMESSIMLPTIHFPPYHASLQYHPNSSFHQICRNTTMPNIPKEIKMIHYSLLQLTWTCFQHTRRNINDKSHATINAHL
jgi:hypothetical protein